MTVEVLAPEVFRVTASVIPSGGANIMDQAFALFDDDHFLGFGERFNKFDQRGETVPCWTEEGGIGLGPDAPPSPSNPFPNGPLGTWWPVPFFLSTRGYGILLDTGFKSVFELGSVLSDAWRLEVWDSRLSYYFF